MFYKSTLLPMNLQLFGEGGEGGAGGNPGGAGGADNGGNGSQGGAGAPGGSLSDEQIASIVAAVEARQQRAGNSAIKSLADQYGLSAEEVSAILKSKQDENAKKLPPEAQAQIDAANQKVQTLMLSTELTKIGATMGLVDVDAALAFIDKDKIKYTDKGIEGVKEALEALKTAKSYLFQNGNGSGGAWGQQRQGGAPEKKPGTLHDALSEYYNKR